MSIFFSIFGTLRQLFYACNMSKKGVEGAVLEYLNAHNRPYSAVDIFNNLHKEYGKTAVVKALESLAASGSIHEKIYGKQKAYAPLQDQYGDYDENELKNLDKEIAELQEELKLLHQQNSKQQTELSSLTHQMTTEEAMATQKKLTGECEKMKTKISEIKEGSNPITPEQKDKIYKENKENVKLWKARKRMAMDIVNSILEGYPKSKKQLLEDIGLETDEDVGVTYPS